uniref:Protein-arginine deiminase C-terminal domain-containing protein n=1 Tax=Taeniopygia guttata TaxID=59729 RepID=A0A674HAZ6_TAEGU
APNLNGIRNSHLSPKPQWDGNSPLSPKPQWDQEFPAEPQTPVGSGIPAPCPGQLDLGSRGPRGRAPRQLRPRRRRRRGPGQRGQRRALLQRCRQPPAPPFPSFFPQFPTFPPIFPFPPIVPFAPNFPHFPQFLPSPPVSPFSLSFSLFPQFPLFPGFSPFSPSPSISPFSPNFPPFPGFSPFSSFSPQFPLFPQFLPFPWFSLCFPFSPSYPLFPQFSPFPSNFPLFSQFLPFPWFSLSFPFPPNFPLFLQFPPSLPISPFPPIIPFAPNFPLFPQFLPSLPVSPFSLSFSLFPVSPFPWVFPFFPFFPNFPLFPQFSTFPWFSSFPPNFPFSLSFPLFPPIFPSFPFPPSFSLFPQFPLFPPFPPNFPLLPQFPPFPPSFPFPQFPHFPHFPPNFPQFPFPPISPFPPVFPQFPSVSLFPRPAGHGAVGAADARPPRHLRRAPAAAAPGLRPRRQNQGFLRRRRSRAGEVPARPGWLQTVLHRAAGPAPARQRLLRGGPGLPRRGLLRPRVPARHPAREPRKVPGPPGVADLHRLRGVPRGSLDHDAQHGGAARGLCVQVGAAGCCWVLLGAAGCSHTLPAAGSALKSRFSHFSPSVDGNEEFVAAVGALAERAQCPLTVCPAPQNRQDRWIQDEMEFGYIQAPHKTLPVVFDSPRDLGLKDFPVKSILGPDFGYVARQAAEGASSLDSFGNLEVSPPVTVQGKEYPLGRILIGSSFPRVGGRRMAKAVRDFLVAQKVQEPVELFSDWLSVGHVDEFLSFVPAPDRKGFRLLLASPSACYQLLREKQEEGFGEAAMFQGLDRVPKPTINEILANEELRKFNDYAQSCISWNRDILKRSLGLAEPDILDIPQLFQSNAASEAQAFFPDMVNMLVLGRHLGIPKPFGPVVGGRCCLEQRVRELLEPLGLSCTFIDDFFSYHVLLGEVHCGTNVRRKPFAFKWWDVVP